VKVVEKWGYIDHAGKLVIAVNLIAKRFGRRFVVNDMWGKWFGCGQTSTTVARSESDLIS